MKRLLRIGAVVLAAGLATLTGCATKSPIPLAENFDLTVQPKVRSAGHWDLLSKDVVTQTLASLRASQIPADTPMYVGLPANPSQFDLGFREFLITKLVQNGQSVYMQPSQAASVALQTKPARRPSPADRVMRWRSLTRPRWCATTALVRTLCRTSSPSSRLA